MSYGKRLILRHNRSASSPLGVKGETRVPRHSILNGLINEKTCSNLQAIYLRICSHESVKNFLFLFSIAMQAQAQAKIVQSPKNTNNSVFTFPKTNLVYAQYFA